MSDGNIATGRHGRHLRTYFEVALRRKWFILAPTVILTLASVAYSVSQPDLYRASADVLIRRPPNSVNLVAPDQPLTVREAQTELRRARGSTIRQTALEAVGGEATLGASLADGGQTDVLVFSAASRDPNRAAEAANAYAEAYVQARRQALTSDLATRAAVVNERLLELEGELGAYEGDPVNEGYLELLTQKNQLRQELSNLTTAVSLASSSGAEIIDHATVPGEPFEPNTRRSAFLALTVSALLGLGVAFGLDYLDNSVRDEHELADIASAPVLAVIPRFRGLRRGSSLISSDSADAPAVEAYRSLRTSLLFLQADQQLNVVQVTSARPGDGKSTTAANLAVTCASAGQRVLLIDCDLRRPSLHRLFGLPSHPGLTDLIAETTSYPGLSDLLADSASHPWIHQSAKYPDLSIITAGTTRPKPSEFLGSQELARLILNLRSSFDLIIVDSPPVLAVTDPMLITPLVDGVLLVVAAAATKKPELDRAMTSLGSARAPVIGTVLNATPPGSDASYPYRNLYATH